MATEPKKPSGAGRAAGKPTKPTPAAPTSAADLQAIEARLSTLESGLETADRRLTQQTAALQARIASLEESPAVTARVQVPPGLIEGARYWIDRLADLIRRNPITALILIVAFLLVALID